MLMRGIATMLHAANRRADTDRAGLKGLAAGMLFSSLARRTPMGAAFFAGAMLARRLYKAGSRARAERAQAKQEQVKQTAKPSRAERLAANGQAARRPLNRAEKTAPRRKPSLAIPH